jgi:SAM-dependent methyltransferase
MNMGQFSTFDNAQTQAFTIARQSFARDFLEGARRKIELSTALDVGCGLGDFSKFLADHGFKVTGLDGRKDNIEEAVRRYPEISFLTFDAEDLPTKDLGTFDFVLCFGLLYHLENPFRAIRGLRALTAKVLLIEGICLPDSSPTMALMDEWPVENQGLTYVAFYPSPSCLVKMLYRAGFRYVYSFRQSPDFHLFRASTSRKRERVVLAASNLPLELDNLIPEQDVPNWVPSPTDPWTTVFSRIRANKFVGFAIMRFPRFLKRPWREKREIVSWYLKRKSSGT